MPSSQQEYRGRIAPTPTGYLHLGHGRTFWVAWQRARKAGGILVYRDEDLDPERCKVAFSMEAMKDLRWLGLDWDAGPDDPIHGEEWVQSKRHEKGVYLDAWKLLKEGGHLYPCHRSRKEIARAATRGGPTGDSPDEEPLFPPDWRPAPGTGEEAAEPGQTNWRFRVPDGHKITFSDGLMGSQSFVANHDFGDFLVWRKNGMPSYELAVVVDDLAMGITEVVRGEDLIKSTARQILLYEALKCKPPSFYHCPLVRDDDGKRLAKRDYARGLRALREGGVDPETLREAFRREYEQFFAKRKQAV